MPNTGVRFRTAPYGGRPPSGGLPFLLILSAIEIRHMVEEIVGSIGGCCHTIGDAGMSFLHASDVSFMGWAGLLYGVMMKLQETHHHVGFAFQSAHPSSTNVQQPSSRLRLLVAATMIALVSAAAGGAGIYISTAATHSGEPAAAPNPATVTPPPKTAVPTKKPKVHKRASHKATKTSSKRACGVQSATLMIYSHRQTHNFSQASI